MCVCTRADYDTQTDSPNARLIASAPALLDALKAQEAYFKRSAEVDAMEWPLTSIGLPTSDSAGELDKLIDELNAMQEHANELRTAALAQAEG